MTGQQRRQSATGTFHQTAQAWWCEKCRWSGVVRFAPDEGVWAVKTLIEDAHYAKDPECARQNALSFVRVPTMTESDPSEGKRQ